MKNGTTLVFVLTLFIASSGPAVWAQGQGGGRNQTAPGDASPAWVSPRWTVSQFENDSVSQTTLTFLWVLNVGEGPVDVSVFLHKQSIVGGVETVYETVECTKTVEGGVSAAFWLPLFCDPGEDISNGSLAIVASGPVVPGGYTQTIVTYKNNIGQPDVLHQQSQDLPLQFYSMRSDAAGR